MRSFPDSFRTSTTIWLQGYQSRSGANNSNTEEEESSEPPRRQRSGIADNRANEDRQGGWHAVSEFHGFLTALAGFDPDPAYAADPANSVPCDRQRKDRTHTFKE